MILSIIQEILLLTKSFSLSVYIIFIIGVFSFFQQDVLKAQPSEENIFSPENRLKFGDFLFCGKDYLRAVSEYRSYLQLQSSDTVRYKVGVALSEMGHYSESIDNFKGLFYNSTLGEEAKLEFIKLNFITESGKYFRDLVENKTYAIDNHSVSLTKLYYASFLKDNVLPDSVKLLSAFDDEGKNTILNFYSRRKYPGFKDENLAGLLSAVLPGLGKIYSDETGDGITSFLFTGVLTFLAVNNFNNNHPTRGWIFTGLAAYFYAGNIYGSMAAAQNYNAAVKFQFDSDFNLFLNSRNYFIPQQKFLCE
jgi:hypothetical protein